jgi:ribose transport system ATP-binding protein
VNQSAPVAGRPAVVLSGISKSFGGIRALDNVDLAIAPGEIHALLGENGAGKSTILKILRGVLTPDGGSVEINGKRLAPLSAEAARQAGVAMIFQEMSLIPTLSAAQNIFLSHEPRGAFGLIDDGEALRRARVLFEELGVDIDPASLAGDLGTGQRQLTEIVKAMSQQQEVANPRSRHDERPGATGNEKPARILILDEPTSALSAGEVDRLFAFLRRLRAEGVAIVYVSHRMDEVVAIADRVTILRDGRHVITASLKALSLEAIIAHIVGRRVSNFADLRGPETTAGEAILELARASGAHKPREVSLSLRCGEVLGIAGLLGSGRSSLARLIAGIAPVISGEIRIRGQSVRIAGPGDAVKKGIALVPEDRIRQGLVVEHSVASNIALPMLERISRWSFVSRRETERLAAEQIARLRIKTPSPDSAVRGLSGGNQQKVVLAKSLAAEPDILILDEPTAGIDIGSKSEIIALIRDLARSGKAILLISSELGELLAASDRIAVMANGRIVAEVARGDLAPNTPPDPAEPSRAAEHRLQHMLQESRLHA